MQYSAKDRTFVFNILRVPTIGRTTAKKLLHYLKKHEHPIDLIWVQHNLVNLNLSVNKKIIDSIKKYFNENKIYSIPEYEDKHSLRVLFFWEEAYPSLLRQADDYPLFLFVRGDMTLLQRPSISVVGSRKMDSYGSFVTEKIVSQLCKSGYCIVSGFMTGVDLLAHTTALGCKGKTIAVLGYGFDYCYPAHLRTTRDEFLVKGACFISEYFPETAPQRGFFPERNRIVAALSQAVVVTQAAQRSGTLITAACALEAGRDVFAVSGPISNLFSEGTKWLINQGAYLITNGQDVVAQLENYTKIAYSQVKTTSPRQLTFEEI